MSEQPAVQADVKLYGRLLGYVKPYWLVFVVSALGLALFSAMNAAFFDLFNMLLAFIGQASGETVQAPGVAGSVLASDAASQSSSLIAKLLGEPLQQQMQEDGRLTIALLFIVVATVRGIGFFVGSYGMAYIGSYLVHNLRTDVFNKMTRLPTAYFDSHMSGHLISRLTFHVTQVTHAATQAVKTLVTEGSQVIFYLAMLFYYSWKLTLLFLVVMPFIGLVVRIVGKSFRRISLRIQSAQGDVTQVSQELINGFRVMRVFGGEKYESQRMNKASGDNRRQTIKMGIVQGASSPVIQLLITAMMAFLIYLALGPTFLGEISVSELVTYLIIAGALTRPVRKLTSIMAPIQKGLAAAQSIFQTLDSDEERDGGSMKLENVRGQFAFDDVSFSYNSSAGRAVKNISFAVNAGETIALVGSSGSGKSTLVNLIPRFYNHCEGQVLLDGIDLNDICLTNLRSQISFVNQQVTLFNDTIYNNIAYGQLADAPREKVIEAARQAHCLEFIETLPDGFDTVVGDNGAKLSGGQRQRVVIARALLKESPILILDEATSALDSESEQHIQDALEQLMKGRTTFVIAHRLSTIENADRILVMHKGQLVEQGTHEELLALNGRYCKLHKKGLEESAEKAAANAEAQTSA